MLRKHLHLPSIEYLWVSGGQAERDGSKTEMSLMADLALQMMGKFNPAVIDVFLVCNYL